MFRTWTIVESQINSSTLTNKSPKIRDTASDLMSRGQTVGWVGWNVRAREDGEVSPQPSQAELKGKQMGQSAQQPVRLRNRPLALVTLSTGPSSGLPNSLGRCLDASLLDRSASSGIGSKLRSLFLSGLMFAVLAGAGALAIGTVENRWQAEEQQSMTAIVDAVSHFLETQLTRSLSATNSLSSMFRGDGGWPPCDFDWFADNLIERTGGIHGLQLAPDGIVPHAYPLLGNEKSVCQDLLNEPNRPSRPNLLGLPVSMFGVGAVWDV